MTDPSTGFRASDHGRAGDVDAGTVAQNAPMDATDPFALLFDRSRIGRVLLDARQQIVRSNAAYARLLGAQPAALVGRGLDTLIHPDDLAAERDRYARVLDGSLPESQQRARYLASDGRVIWLDGIVTQFAMAGQIGCMAELIDVTAQVAAEAASKRQIEHSRFLTDLRERLDRVDAPDAVLEIAAAALGSLLRVDIVHIHEIDRAAGLVRLHSSNAGAGLAPGVHALSAIYTAETQAHLSAGRVVVIADVRADPLTAGRAAAFERHGVRASLGVPLLRDGAWMGVLILAHGEPRDWRDDLDIVRTATERIWLAYEHARLLRDLRDREERLSFSLDAAAAGSWDWDIPSGAVVWSLQNYALYERAPAAGPLAYADWELCLHPDDRAHTNAAIQAVVDGRAPEFRSEFRVLRADGSLRWLLGLGRVERASDGTARRMSGINIDITARKHAEANLYERESLFRALATVSPVGIFRTDADGNCIYVNERWSQISGLSLDEALGMGWANGVFPEDRAAVFTGWVEASRAQRPFVAEYRFFSKGSGTVTWVLGQAVAETNAAGQVTGSVGTLTDITERKQTEEALRENRAFLRRITSIAPTILYIYDLREARNVWINDSMFATLGYTPADVAAMGPDLLGQLLHHADAERYVAHLEHLRQLLPDQMAEFEYRMRHKDGSWRWLASREMVYMRDDTGPVTQIIGAAYDVTERRQAEYERAQLLEREQQARRAAQDAVDIRDAFLSIAAHELKNPLTTLLGNAQLLRRRADRAGTYAERDVRIFSSIAEQATRMNQLIAALLDSSRLETGQLQIVPAPLDLVALVQRVLDELVSTLEQHHLSWQAPAQQIVISGDELRLTQVLQNLLGNAIKYSPQGGTITVQAGQDAATGWVAIRDQGLGIPAEAIPQLFRRFFRAENVTQQRISGIGVGLYVVHEIVTLHGGRVEVESQEGRGSTFTVRLPLAQADAAARFSP